MFDNEHPIRVIEIDKDYVKDGYGIAYSVGLSILSDTKTTMQKSRSKILFDRDNHGVHQLFSSICVNGVRYETPENRYYWFPETPEYKNIPKNSYYLRLSTRCDLNAIVITIIENSVPFLDKSGTFQHKSIIMSTENKDGEWSESANTISTLFVSENKAHAILDHDRNLIYSIKRQIRIRKITQM